MGKIAATLAIGLALAGCASGTILNGSDIPIGSAALLSASTGTVIRVAPLHRPDQAAITSPGKPLDLFVSAGWYRVVYSCDVQYQNGEAIAVTIREYTTERNVRVRAGHKYSLACSPEHMGVLHVRDLGLVPNNSFKPKPLRGSA